MYIKSTFFLTVFSILIVFGYERNLYSLYPLINLAAIGGVFFFYILYSERMKLTKWSMFASLLLLIAMIAALLRGDANDFVKYVVSLSILLVIWSYLKDGDISKVLYSFASVCLVLSVIGLIGFMAGISYFSMHGRMVSVFHDPNYTAALTAFSFLYFYFQTKKPWLDIRVAILFLSLVATFSKSALLCTIIAISFYYFVQNSVKRLVIFSFSGLIMSTFILEYFLNLLASFDLYRVEMGFNLRDIYAKAAIDGAMRSPFIGNGISNISEEIYSLGLNILNTSFHNYYLEALYSGGFLYFSSIILSMIFCLVSLMRTSPSDAAIFLFLCMMANSFSFAIGGVGALSIILTLFYVKGFRANDNTYR